MDSDLLIPLLIMGGIALLFIISEVLDAQKRKNWPLVDLQVLGLSIERERKSSRVSYSVTVEFSGSFNDVDIHLTHSHSRLFNLEKEAQEWCASMGIEVGKPTSVHLKKEAPHDQCIFPK